MKLNTTTQTAIESSGVSGENGFKLKSSRHAFQLLSSGLYTNKIQAVIRELSCNAADAHVLNNNQQKAFDIKLPNRLDSQFYVRDYGPGLSDDGVMNLYTTYFESTKSDSNDFTGGFGVGSKSPFAYTDMFTVESIHNGFKNVYTAYTDDNGEPKIVRLGAQEPTDKPSGLSVGFPVKPEDFVMFEREANTVLQWFEVPVNVQGVAELPQPWHAKKMLLRTPNVAIPGYWDNQQPLYAGFANNERGSTMVGKMGVLRMGNVHYPLPMHPSLENLPESQWFNSKAAIFNVPVGAVSVAASREALAFDKTTQSAMASILQNAFVDVSKVLWTKIAEDLNTPDVSLAAHMRAYRTLHNIGLGQHPKLMSIFLDNCEVSDEKKELLKIRTLYDPKNPPKTFSLCINENPYHYNGNNLIGSPAEWKTNIRPEIDYDRNNKYVFLENAGRATGLHANAAMQTLVKNLELGYNAKIIQIIPHAKVDPAQYEAEKSAWAKKLGVTPKMFSRMGQSFGDNSIEALNPFSWNKNVSLIAETPPFFYLTSSEWEHLQSKNQKKYMNLTNQKMHELQRNLKLKSDIKEWYIIQNEDADRIKTICPQALHLYNDFVLTTLLDPKVQKRIEKIQPMMDSMPSMFSTTRAKMRKEWGPVLGSTKLGAWVTKMDKVKSSQSYDYSTMSALQDLHAALGDKFPTHIPEFYKGKEVTDAIEKGYPFLETHAASRDPLIPSQLQHLKEYIDWCESRGATPPKQTDEPSSDSPTP